MEIKSLTERTIEEGKWQQRKWLSERKHAYIHPGRKTKTFIHNCIAVYMQSLSICIRWNFKIVCVCVNGRFLCFFFLFSWRCQRRQPHHSACENSMQNFEKCELYEDPTITSKQLEINSESHYFSTNQSSKNQFHWLKNI